MPDYEIKCWDAESLKEIDNTFVKEAFEARKWAFVADYVRFYALKKYGGIYLDSDVEVYKSFDQFLNYSFFTGTDISRLRTIVGPEAAIIGCEPNHPFLDEFLKYYDNRHFVSETGELDMTVLPKIMGHVLEKYGYKFEDTNQELPYNTKIFSSEYFCNKNSVQYRQPNFAFHKNSNFWIYSYRGWLCLFCWKHHMLPAYHFLEKLLARFHK
jgi:mannosyltransferase OCH1-like enzyme